MPLVKINQIIKPIVLIWLLCPILSFSQNIGYVDVGRVIKESNEMIYRGSVIDKLTNQSVKQHEDFNQSQFLIDVELDILYLERDNYASKGEAVPASISTAIYNYENEKNRNSQQYYQNALDLVNKTNEKVEEYNMRLNSIQREIDSHIEIARKQYGYSKVYKDLHNIPFGSQYYDLTDIIISIVNSTN